MELVQEIHQVILNLYQNQVPLVLFIFKILLPQLLMDREETSHRTCFSLQLNGQTLDNFVELKTIEGLKEGSLIKVS
jgi:hypothetical protein